MWRLQANQIGAITDQISRYGSGIIGIPDGPTKITLTAPGSGLLLQVSAGHAMIGGPVELAAASTIAVPDNTARVFLWLRRAGAAVVATTTVTAPSGESAYLGNCVTSGGNITSVDYSGVVYLRGGVAFRNTNDNGAPSDTPPANALLITQTAFCDYLWDSVGWRQLYIPNVTADPSSPGTSDQWFRTDLLVLKFNSGSPLILGRKGVLLALCSAFTPSGTGADTAELTVPFDPADGTTSITWNVRALIVRVQTAGGAPAVTFEVSTIAGAFSAATIGSVTLGSGAYEGSNTSMFTIPTVVSGNKIRLNFTALGTAVNFSCEILLGQ